MKRKFAKSLELAIIMLSSYKYIDIWCSICPYLQGKLRVNIILSKIFGNSQLM